MRIVGDFNINGPCRNIFKTLNVLTILLLYVLGTCLLKKVNVAIMIKKFHLRYTRSLKDLKIKTTQVKRFQKFTRRNWIKKYN